MKAVVAHGADDLRVDEVPEPELVDPGDAIVDVRATAICGADLFPYHGYVPGFEPGTILGHEFVGVVAAAGPAVRSLAPGDRVVCGSTLTDGTCTHCRAGRPTQCFDRALFGFSGVYRRLDGGQAERVRVPKADRCLWTLPDSVSNEAAVFVADILPTGFNAVERGGVSEGDTVVVLGCGPVGLMAVLCAVPIAANVVAVDGIEARRSLAERLGATAVVDPTSSAALVEELTSGVGADVVIEAAGAAQALDSALLLARGRGTVSVVGAHFERDYPLDNLTMFEKELTVRFSWGDPTSLHGRLLELVGDGSLDPTPVITHVLPLEQAVEGYRLFDGREATKVVLTA
jgi:alcohol dehydrogenase